MTNYKEDVKIDIYNLHEEWEKQPSLSEKYGDLYASAISDREHNELIVERKKDELKEEYARLDNEIRSNYKEYNFKAKPTDAGIKCWIIIQDSYKAKQKEIYDATKELIMKREQENKLKAVYYSFQDRKSALEGCARLYLSGYYSGLKVDEEFGMKRRD